jgi:hypothetical protein
VQNAASAERRNSAVIKVRHYGDSLRATTGSRLTEVQYLVEVGPAVPVLRG